VSLVFCFILKYQISYNVTSNKYMPNILKSELGYDLRIKAIENHIDLLIETHIYD
jgi:hypothetical protein